MQAVLSWNGATADFHVGISGSATASSGTVRMSMPIAVYYFAATKGYAPKALPLGDMGVSIFAARRDTALGARFNHEGEARMVGVHDDAKALESFFPFYWSLRNGTDNDDRRIAAVVNTSGDVRFSHYDGAGLIDSVDVNLAALASEWTVRQRWSTGGLMDNSSVYSEGRAAANQGDGRLVTWTPDVAVIDDVKFGEDMGGLISQIVLSCRELPA